MYPGSVGQATSVRNVDISGRRELLAMSMPSSHHREPYERKNVILELNGLEFDWFAIDREGNLALFATAGEGFVPHSVAEHYLFHLELSDSLAVPHHGTPDIWTDYAAVGLFVFDWRLPGGPYEKRASPLLPPDPALTERITTLHGIPCYSGSFDVLHTVVDWE